MILAKHTISIFNRFLDGVPPFFQGGRPPAESYNKTLVRYAQWEDSADRNSANDGRTSIDKHIQIIIPLKADTQGRKYIGYRDYELLPNEQKLNFWTLKINECIIAFGDAPELSSSFTIEKLKESYKHCLVKAVEDLTLQPILPHWEIVGI